ncbi:hypothetical protein KAFR_0I02670 [Kazachstania africana CBS 2517]|uniref:ER-derived vesicles protein ERV29 n=1 Tax=Kazachstania africana (strain ATCC 22294 / BCRC 22015 / CBS 2517 / CECT 1963 / NBRC 1671 / NRRL Y-8276) TaxID=1071382 RepID=H2B096_KAZAF|nr:hypothetical protein KAFR_0I02670 [Kazachstania africana CBS 2517]CCF60046.1 hypothetical protein KAFR_0I02670 [Kazachstania africana CBS 2517]
MSYRGPVNSFQPSASSFGTGNRNFPSQNAVSDKANLQHKFKQFKDKFEHYTDKIEELTDYPIVIRLKPYIPTIAKFFIVATFYEDSIRIVTQWKDQVFYLHAWKHYPVLFVYLFLAVVSCSMFVGSTLLILNKYKFYTTGVLCACIVLQALVYGLVTGAPFLLRNFSVIGGLLIELSDTFAENKVTSGMLPELGNKNSQRKSYLLLAGRILIVLMFIGFTFNKSYITLFLTMVFTVFFAIGYKTKLSSLVLGFILAFYNMYLNHYWFRTLTERDYLKYEFYQNLSIIGALLLVTNTGAGKLSIDEKKKIY